MLSNIKKFWGGQISGGDLSPEKAEKANRRLRISGQEPENVIEFPIKPNGKDLESAISTFQEGMDILGTSDQKEKEKIKNKILKEIDSYLDILDEKNFGREINKLKSIKNYIEEKY